MHTFNETAAGVPAFLAKLWRLVDDPETNELICWSKDGRSFIIQNQAQFARELLPQNYKHNNMASFIRQLNMYGFHKITSIDNGGLKFDRDEMEFSHPYFKRNSAYLLEHIKRKIANTKSIDEKTAMKPEAVTKVLQDVKAMRGRQDSLDSRFSVMKQENEALWREIASLRQKHAKQQQIVNKLIQFLITIVQPSRNMTSVKRHMQLMIHDTPDHAKLRKDSESESDSGPVIHELGEELLDGVNEVDDEIMGPDSPYAKAGLNINASPLSINIERPQSSISTASPNYDFSNQSTEDANEAGNSGNPVGRSMQTDDSEIIYHVTEIPDVQPHDSVTAATADLNPNIFSDNNVLQTPLMRQEIARSQLLKQKNKLRRMQQDCDGLNMPESFDSTQKNAKTSRKAKVDRTYATTSSSTPSSTTTQIKSESADIDPMTFLNSYTDPNIPSRSQQTLISPNLNEDSMPTNANTANQLTLISNPNTPTNDASLLDNTNINIYNATDFIPNDIPSDIFDNSFSMGDDGSTLQQPTHEQSADLNGKFASINNNINKVCSDGSGKVGSNGNILPNGPSTSAAAAINSASIATPDSTFPSASRRKDNTETGNDSDNMAVTKYKLENLNNDLLQLDTADEVHGHLDTVQDELETLKELLRGDGYSLDASTLLGLFNDSDIIGPYGLQFSTNDVNENKKDSEGAVYQPIYDLSDIMDINNAKPALMSSSESPKKTDQMLTNTAQGTPMSLNTPHHE